MINKLWLMLHSLILNSLFYKPNNYGAGQGEFGSRGGTNERQTGVMYDKTRYLQVLQTTIFGTLSKRNKRMTQMDAYNTLDGGIDKSTFVWKQVITKGDQYILTYEEAMSGMGTYGDAHVVAGDFPAYKNQDFRIHRTKSPAAQVIGDMAQQRVAYSLKNVDASTKQLPVVWQGEELEFDAIIAYLYGASKSLIAPASDQGLAISLGPDGGIGAGIPLLPMHFYTKDSGFIEYDGSALSTHNSLVNDAINGIDISADDKFTLSQHEMIRERIGELKFIPGTIMGKTYKAIGLMDPQIAFRLNKSILKTSVGASGPRENDYKNRIWHSNFMFELDGILYISVENLRKFRMAYNAGNGYPDIGPGLSLDPRTYTTTSDNALVIYCGAGSLLYGTNGLIDISVGHPKHPKDATEYSAWQKFGLKRNQWDTNDGREESTCNSVLVAAFYEPGIDW